MVIVTILQGVPNSHRTFVMKQQEIRNKVQVTLVYGLAQLFLVGQLFRDLEQIM